MLVEIAKADAAHHGIQNLPPHSHPLESWLNPNYLQAVEKTRIRLDWIGLAKHGPNLRKSDRLNSRQNGHVISLN